jgi:hypothetical protein
VVQWLYRPVGKYSEEHQPMPLIVPILDEVCIVIKIKAEWVQRFSVQEHIIVLYMKIAIYWLDGLCALCQTTY